MKNVIYAKHFLILYTSRVHQHRGGSRTAATSKMEHFEIIVNGWKPLTIITKSSILDVAAVLDPPLPTGQTIGNSILLLLQRNGTDLSKCRAQAYDGASAMSREASGAVSVIKKEQPLAEYAHYRNHIFNVAVSYACKNQSIKKIMDNLTSVC